jgi:hypothetical protein
MDISISPLSSRNHKLPLDPFRQYHDATGPERIFSFYAPASQMRAMIDTTVFGISEGTFRLVRERISANTALVLLHSRERHCAPYTAAFQIIQERWHQHAPPGRILAVAS